MLIQNTSDIGWTNKFVWEVLPDGAWKGRPCFIVGGGTSLKSFDWTLLKGHLTIGINRAFEAFKPTIIFTMDRAKFLRWILNGQYGEEARLKFVNSKSIKVVLCTSQCNLPSDIYVVKAWRDFSRSFNAFPFTTKYGIGHGSNSGYGAINLAVCLGANPIYLLGFDMYYDGAKTHWHSGHPKRQISNALPKFIKFLNVAANKLKNTDFKVINLNPHSKLNCFEKADIDKVLPGARLYISEKRSIIPFQIMSKPEKPKERPTNAPFGTGIKVSGFIKKIKQKESGKEVLIGVSGRKTITAITPTGDRPLAFALCQQWMKHQMLKPDQWIVVDDGKVPMKPSIPMQYVRRQPQISDPKHTLILNLKKAMPLIEGDKIIIIEDDEYYAPGYVAEMALRLNQYEVVGIGRSKYYHLPSGGHFKIGNTTHASLAETSFRSSFLPEFKELLNKNNVYLDLNLWKEVNRNKKGFIFIDSDENPLYVGMKGLPGRIGIGRGHDSKLYKNNSYDITRETLRKWIPKNYEIYMDILKRKLTDSNYQLYFSGITGITVCSNTKDLIERAYVSIRKFHPDMPIIIIDGSTPGDLCASYVKGLVSDVTTVISLGYNIGHGRGMCMGIDKVKTPYALIFDSDIEMLKSPIQAMFEMMEEDTFGIGYIQKTGLDGFDYGIKPHHKREEGMLYLHPFFHLINIENYKKFHPYVHHGAPCYLTMRDIHKQGLSNKILKEFPDFGHSDGQGYNWKGRPREYIRHDVQGTRKIRGQKGLPTIEGKWEYK